MSFLYKLVDEKEKDMALDGVLSLSHPIFEFQGSEGKFINFAHRIYKSIIVKDLLSSLQKDLEDIKEWIEIYKKHMAKGLMIGDINSESMITFCGMQGFCIIQIKT